MTHGANDAVPDSKNPHVTRRRFLQTGAALAAIHNLLEQ